MYMFIYNITCPSSRYLRIVQHLYCPQWFHMEHCSYSLLTFCTSNMKLRGKVIHFHTRHIIPLETDTFEMLQFCCIITKLQNYLQNILEINYKYRS